MALNLPRTFATIASRVSSAMGAPFFDGQIVDQANVAYDDGGSIVSSDAPTVRACRVQIDAASEAMKSSQGYVEGDVRFILLSASFTGSLNTDAVIEILTGDRAGTWQVSAIELDPAGIGYAGQGRRL